jgi:nucleoside-diphosphate-sugar epimerase
MSIIDDECKKILESINGKEFINKRILITGSTGQIGSYFVSYFYQLKQIDQSIIVDAYYSTSIPLHLTKYSSQINFIKVDLSDFLTVRNEFKYDYIIYGAGYGQPSKFMEKQDSTYMINSYGLTSCLSMLQSNGNLLFLSTSEVYSENMMNSQSENDNIVLNLKNSRNSYVLSKLMGEEIIKSRMHKNSNLKVARICLAYGPGTSAQDTRVLNEFIKKAKKFRRIELMDQGESIRSYCYIANTIEMSLRILLYGKSLIYNVGNPNKISILGLAEMVSKILNGTEVILPLDTKKYMNNARTKAPSVVNINCDKYQDEFGPTEYISLYTGLTNTIKWQENNFDWENMNE